MPALPGTDARHHTLVVLVENKSGVLARVASLFARRGFNIFSLAVAPTEDDRFSRITIVVDVESKQLSQSAGIDRSNWPFQPPLERASALRGKNVKDGAGKAVGEIEDVVINLGNGKLEQVILAQDGRKGDEPKQMLPPRASSVEKGAVVLRSR